MKQLSMKSAFSGRISLSLLLAMHFNAFIHIDDLIKCVGSQIGKPGSIFTRKEKAVSCLPALLTTVFYVGNSVISNDNLRRNF